MSNDFGSGFESVDLAGELIDMEDLMDNDLDGFMEWAVLHKSDTVHHDDLCDWSQDAENWIEYGEWLEQFEHG